MMKINTWNHVAIRAGDLTFPFISFFDSFDYGNVEILEQVCGSSIMENGII